MRLTPPPRSEAVTATPINSVRSHLVDLRIPRALETPEHVARVRSAQCDRGAAG